MELSDNVIPASNSSFAKSLFKLGKYFYNEEYTNLAAGMLSRMKSSFVSNALYHSNWGILMIEMVYLYYEVAIVGDDWKDKRSQLVKVFHPNVLLLGGETMGTLELLKQKLAPGKTMIYVCVNKNCKLPVEEIQAAEEQIN